MSAETQAVDEIMDIIRHVTAPESLNKQQAANVLSEIAEQVDDQLNALQEEGVEPE